MPHQCVRCGKLIEDGSDEILKGCSKCGSHFFFFIKKDALDKLKQEKEKPEELFPKLTPQQRIEVEQDVKEIIGPEIEEDKPIILDLATINILEPGKFELDLVKLFKGAPVIYKLEEGKYIIDVASTFQMKMGEAEE